MFCFCHGRVCVISDHIVKEKKKWNGNDCDDVGNQTPYIYIWSKNNTHVHIQTHAHIHNLTERCDAEKKKKRGDEDKKQKEEKYIREWNDALVNYVSMNNDEKGEKNKLFSLTDRTALKTWFLSLL
jgi:hypothetical protein